MKTSLTLKGKVGQGGFAEGEALVVKQSFSFWGTVDQYKGTIMDKWNEARGKCFSGKVLVVPSTKGSSGNWLMIKRCGKLGTAPAAIISQKGDPLIVGGCIEANIPYIYDLNKSPLDFIQTGDLVKINGETGIVKIQKN